MEIRSALRRHILAAFIVVGIAATGVPVAGQSSQDVDPPGEVTAVQPIQPGANGDIIFAELVRQNELRSAGLREYSAVRTYSVTSLSGKVHAKETVRMEYIAPDKKTFVTTSEEGSHLVRHMVLNRLIESETSAAVGKEHHDSSITPANYTFRLLAEEDVGTHHCFVVEAIPKRKDKYLFEGTVWIDDRDFAIVRIAGHPAKKLSFWITRADFVRQYEKIGDFWLPVKDETFVDVRVYGKKILTIEHHIDAVNGVKSAALAGEKPNAVSVSEKTKSE
jgi:outer membrane lipoprotein-sorting protein